MIRQAWIDKEDEVSVVQQCALAGVSRATIYAQQKPKLIDESDLLISRLIDEEYTRRPFYGSRRMVIFLRKASHIVNRKRVQRLMRQMGLAGMAPGPNTSRAHPEHKVYPYLLRGVPVVRPNQVWSTDITYIRLARGFAYLVAVIDWYSRRVLSWRISNNMEAAFCVDCLEEAIRSHGTPEIFNTDQGSQFTSDAFTGVLKREGIVISMDGRGRAFDNIFVERLWRNVKHEDVYLKGYGSMLHGGCLHRKHKIKSNSNNRSKDKTGAAPSSCYRSRMYNLNLVDHCLDPGVHFTPQSWSRSLSIHGFDPIFAVSLGLV
jgi:putative transposase